MRYCGNTTCSSVIWRGDSDGTYCPACGGELTECIRCLCGKAEYNPRTPAFMPKFCSYCGQEVTNTYLAQCMSAQLKGMVNKIAQEHTIIGSLTD